MKQQKISHLAFLEGAVRDQRKWLAEHGYTLEAYIRQYGDPGVKADDGKPMFGDGGTLIFEADLQALQKKERELSDYKPSSPVVREEWIPDGVVIKGYESAARKVKDRVPSSPNADMARGCRPSLIESPPEARKLTQIQPGIYVAQDAYTGTYQFFPHSPVTYYVRGKIVSQEQYESHLQSLR